MTQSEEGKKNSRSELAQMLELPEKDIKAVNVLIVLMFKT